MYTTLLQFTEPYTSTHSQDFLINSRNESIETFQIMNMSAFIHFSITSSHAYATLLVEIQYIWGHDAGQIKQNAPYKRPKIYCAGSKS